MGANVFANSLEVSCEKASNQSIAAMPDVCLSPPTPPAGPVPIPYPNFSSASDTTDGTTTVKIGGGQVGIKNKSCYKQSKGDEAATKSQGMGVVTACIQGKTYFTAWSSDVKFEGENAVRLSDMTTHNHGSDPMNSGSTTVSTGQPGTPPTEKDCEKLDEKNKEERKKVTEELKDENSLNKEEQKTLDKAQGTGMTVSSVNSQVPGAEGIFSGCSSGCAQTFNPSGLVSGGTSEQKMGGAGTLCDDSYTHCAGGSGAHAEAKIVNHMSELPGSSMRGGSMLFNIDWRFKRGGEAHQSGMPCTQCHKMMCHAMKECEIKIFICDKDGKPQPLTEEDCKGDDQARENLCMKIDGNSRPGR